MSPDDPVALAASYIGTAEIPDGSNETPFSRWYGIIGPWCAMFVSYCLAEAAAIVAGARAGLPTIPAPFTAQRQGFAWCPSGVQWFKDHGLWHTGTTGIARGDLVFYSFSSNGLADHVEIVEFVAGRELLTIGGNVSNKVGRWRRPDTLPIGYGRPFYSSRPLTDRLDRIRLAVAYVGGDVSTWPECRGNLWTVPSAVASFQGAARIHTDGVYGPETMAALVKAEILFHVA